MSTRLGERPVTSDVDSDRVLAMLSMLNLTDGPVHVLTIPGAPYSKSRPKFTRSGRTYHPAADKDAERRTAIYLHATVRRQYLNNVAMACLFYRPDRRVIDTDNLLKHVCDAGNGILYVDDCQVTGKLGVVELDRQNPRTVVALGVHESTLLRDYSDKSKPKGTMPLWD